MKKLIFALALLVGTAFAWQTAAICYEDPEIICGAKCEFLYSLGFSWCGVSFDGRDACIDLWDACMDVRHCSCQEIIIL